MGSPPRHPLLRVYLAGATTRFRELRALRNRLLGAGVAVTSSWIDQPDARLDRPRDEALPAEVASQAAAADLADVWRADVLVLDAEGLAEGRGGAHFEAGYAFAHGKAVAVLGRAVSIFYSLPGVRQFDTEEGLLAWLAVWPEEREVPHGGA